MATKRCTHTELKTHPGMAYSVLKCAPEFSLAAAMQAAVADERFGDFDYTNETHGVKRKREGSAGDSEEDLLACPDGHGQPGAGSQFRRPELAPQPEPSFHGRSEGDHTHGLKVPQPSDLIQKKTRKEHKKERKRLKREEKRRQDFVNNTNNPRPDDVTKFVGLADTISVEIDTDELPANSSGYDGTFKDAMGDEVLKFDDLIADGYELIEWDGTKPLVITEAEDDRIFVVGVGKPESATYNEACNAAAELLLELGVSGGFTQEEIEENLRGPNFMALNFGIGAGHGPPKPYNLRNNKHQDVVDQLRASSALKRLALHQSGSFKFYFPELYDYYHKHTISVRQKHQELVANWSLSIFSAAAVNLGPEVATYFHRDGRNLAFGPCAIHALGKYDFTKGGHLVLKEPKLIIQFPPGCLILLPSATITHGNTPVREGEKRVSFTQYTAGALFRYVDNGFRTEAQLKKKSKALYNKILKDKETRWEMGIGMWPTVEELLERAPGRPVSEGGGQGDT